MPRGGQVGNYFILMGCKHCSFKSYCIKPWIPSITELQNGNKKEGKKIPLPPSRPALQAAPQQDRQQPASPSPTPSQLRPAPGTEEPGTDLGPQASPTSGVKVKGEGFLAPPQPPRGIRWQSFRPGWVQQGSLSPRPPAPAGSAQVGALPRRALGAQGPWTVPTWSLLTPCRHGSGSRIRSRERRGETRQGVGRKISPNRSPARTRASPWGGGSQRRDASRRTPGRLGTQLPRGPPRGVAKLTASGALGGARLRASPASPGSSGRWGRAVRSAATPGGAFVPQSSGVGNKGLRLPLPQVFNLKQ